MSSVNEFVPDSGIGVIKATILTAPPQNPSPSTKRGWRRHAARPENEMLRASKVWGTDARKTFVQN